MEPRKGPGRPPKSADQKAPKKRTPHASGKPAKAEDGGHEARRLIRDATIGELASRARCSTPTPADVGLQAALVASEATDTLPVGTIAALLRLTAGWPKRSESALYKLASGKWRLTDTWRVRLS